MQSLPLLKSGREILTLSIEGSTLRILQVVNKQITAWVNLPFNPALLRNGFIANPKGMAQVIQNALVGKGIYSKGVRAAFPGFQSLSRLITIPRSREVRPDQVIPGEARRLMSVSPEVSYLFWQPMISFPGQQSFFTLAVPKAPLEVFIETLRLTGLRPNRIELKPLVLLKIIDQPNAIIAAVENNSIDIVVVLNWIPMLMRSLYLGEGAITAESGPPRLVAELRRTIGFYNDSNPENPLPLETPLYLCGALAAEGETALLVEREIGLLPGKLDPKLELPPEFPLGQMAVNLALAI